MGPTATNLPGAELESFLEAFEAARARDDEADLTRFLPEPGHPLYAAVLRELVRVDLEYGWQRGRPRRVEEYVRRFPDQLRSPDALQELAFEEYRLRLQAGARPSPEEYRQRYQVEVHGWPVAESSEWDQAPRTRALTPPPDWNLNHVRGSFGEHLPASQPGEWLRELRRSDPETAERLGQALRDLPVQGTEFLGFRLLAELGRGAYGRVFLARQESLANRFVALKVAADVAGESQTLAQLQHTNIVPIYSVHHTGLLQAVCMPYLGSTTLADVLAALRGRHTLPASGRDLVSTLVPRRWDTHAEPGPSDAGPPPVTGGGESAGEDCPARVGTGTVVLRKLEGLTYVNAVLWIVSRLADGLGHAHERGILHRDLKPANVLLTDEGQPMLLDFNLSADTKLPAAARLGGTLPYLAPEHLDAFQGGNRVVDQRSDVYALGVILYELLTRRRPFPIYREAAELVLARMTAERLRPPPRVRPWNPLVSPAVEAVVRHCLEPDPERRYQSAGQLQEDLLRQLNHLPLWHAREPSLRERARKWLRRHPRALPAATLGIVAGLLLVLASLYLLRGRHLARLEALDNLQRFRDESSATRLLSIIPDPEPEELEEAGRLGRQALGRYGVLDVADQERLRGDAGELLLLLARNSRLRAGTESDPHRRGELLRQALELNTRAETTPAHGELLRAIRLQRASLLRQTGQDQDAARLLQEAERMPLRSATDRLLAALEYLGRGEYRQAHPLLLEASRQEPTNPLVWSALGEYYTASGQLDKAADHYNTAIALQPAFYRTYYLRGRAHLLRKDHVQAGADFDRALRLRPGFVPAHLDRAVARLESKDLRGALQDLDRALEGNPQHMRAFFMRSRVRQVLGDAAGARADFEAGLQREPTDEQSWIARGVARVPRDPQGALADFEAAARRNPRSRVALVNQAHVLAERLGRTDEAVRALDQVVALFPEYVPGRASRGVLLARLGRREAALNDAQESLLRDTGPAVTYQVAGIYALTSRQHPEDQAEAYRLLGSALRRGYGRELLAQDRDLDPLRDQPEFQRLIEATKTPRTGAGPTN